MTAQTNRNQLASDLWDAFAADADADGLATLDTAILEAQIAELRGDEADDWPGLSNRAVAVLIQDYATTISLANAG